MKKPTPKDIVVRADVYFVRVNGNTPLAKEWIQRESPSFGELKDDILFLTPGYSAAEVAQYLEDGYYELLGQQTANEVQEMLDESASQTPSADA